MSERDGWNHLYLFDGVTGALKNQITKGDWVVRGVVQVDEEKRQIWFSASGMYPGKDPYFLNYYRINFDGSGLTVETGGYMGLLDLGVRRARILTNNPQKLVPRGGDQKRSRSSDTVCGIVDRYHERQARRGARRGPRSKPSRGRGSLALGGERPLRHRRGQVDRAVGAGAFASSTMPR